MTPYVSVTIRRSRRYQTRTGRRPPFGRAGSRRLHDYVAERLEPVVADLIADAPAAGEIDLEQAAADVADLICRRGEDLGQNTSERV
jgi:hypothetical protein